MNLTSEKSLYYILTAAIVLVLTSALIERYADAKKGQVLAEYQHLKEQNDEYVSLKERWSLQSSQSSYEYFTSHPNLIKQEQRGGKIILEFDHLNEDDFNDLTNKILNSMLIIKKLSMQRSDTKEGKIVVEFQS